MYNICSVIACNVINESKEQKENVFQKNTLYTTDSERMLKYAMWSERRQWTRSNDVVSVFGRWIYICAWRMFAVPFFFSASSRILVSHSLLLSDRFTVSSRSRTDYLQCVQCVCAHKINYTSGVRKVQCAKQISCVVTFGVMLVLFIFLLLFLFFDV